MKNIIVFIMLMSSFATAKTVKVKADEKAETLTQKTGRGGKLGTSFRLNGSTVHGKLPSAAGSTATVEGDKFLEDLIGARKDFSDREHNDLERQ